MVLSTNTSLLSQSHHPCHPATPPTVIDIITAQTLVVATPACVNVLIVYIIKPVITPSHTQQGKQTIFYCFIITIQRLKVNVFIGDYRY